MTNILLIASSPNLQREVALALNGGATDVDVSAIAPDMESLGQAWSAQPDLVVVDRRIGSAQMPQVLGRLREITDSPVIVVNVDNRKAEKLGLLAAGADDYVARPLDRTALRKRMAAALDYGRKHPSRHLVVDNLEVDFESRRVRVDGKDVHLTPTEFSLLEQLASRPGGLLTHERLLREVWGPAYGTESHYLRVYVAQLRRKLKDDASEPRLIVTEPGIGYRWIGGLPR